MRTLSYDNYVEFSEIFWWAEEKKLAYWNHCCDIFHRTGIFENKRIHEFYKKELEEELERLKKPEDTTRDKDKRIEAYEILLSFMKENGVKFMNVLGGDK